MKPASELAIPLLALLVILLASVGRAQEPPTRSNAAPRVPIQNAPSFYVRLDVNHETRSYRAGDTLRVTAVSEADCYAYLLYHQADGTSYQMFPNVHQPNNRLKARQAVSIPAEDDLFRWEVAAPFGPERITLFCTKDPLDALSAEELRAKRFNPVSRQQLKGVELEIGQQPPAAWGVAEVDLATYPRSQELLDPGRQRVGLFVGVAQYQFNIEAEAARGRGLNLSTCHRDARILAELMRETGELSQTRVLTNEQATRKNLEESITRWLPQMTRPGDTVFIYFSGHGGQLPDESRDETGDDTDETIIPFDYITLDILDEVQKRAEAGTLDAAQVPRALEAKAIKDRAGSRDRAALALARDTSITDDVFGHWLQALDGRQVVVILDSCFSGGLATDEKNLFARPKPLKFDFLDRELARLKDLGQRESVLLSASSTLTTAAIRKEDDLSVLTYFLAEAVKRAPAQLTLDEAFTYSKTEMARYFADPARGAGLTPHEPQLFNYSSRPVLLKP